MKNWHLISFLALILSTLGFAEKGGPMMPHGGLGFLFPDANEFINPGQLALNKGFAMQGEYTRVNDSQSQEITPSAVFGTGKFGIGAFADRINTNLTSSTGATDRMGGALGIAVAQQRLTFGVGYDRETSVGQVDDGNLGVSANYIGKERKGFSLGAKAGTTVNALIRNRHAIFGVGYGFTSATSLELVYILNNLERTSDYAYGAAFNLGNRHFYFSAAYTYFKIPALGLAATRLGVNLGPIDISGHVEKFLDKSYQYSYGGSFRVSF
jgi:hypothetical protein